MSSNENLNIGDMGIDFDRRFKMNSNANSQKFVEPILTDIRTLFFDLIRSIVRFRKPLVLSVLTVTVLSWIYIATLEDQYAGVARVSVDSNKVLAPLLKGIVVTPDVNQRVKLLSQTLLNRPNLEKLAKVSGLAADVTDADEYEELIDDLSDDIKLTGTRRKSSIYEVSYTHEDPNVAKLMVQEVLEVFVKSALTEDETDTKFTQIFLDDQKAYYEKELVAADTKLAEFKRLNYGLLPDDREKKELKLDEYKTAVLEGRQALSVAESKLDIYKEKLNQNPKSITQRTSSSASMQTLDALLAEQRSELTSLQVQYTDEYPSIQQLKKSIGELEEQKRRLTSASPDEGGSFRQVANPIYEELKSEYTLAEIEIGALKRQIQDDQQSAERLEATLDSMPDVATELNKILRGNESLLKTYHEILESRESARISKQIGADEEDVNFQVVDPPFVSSNPVGLPKPLLAIGVMMLAAAIGIAIAFVISQFIPVFYDMQTIEARTGRSVIGTVGRHKAIANNDEEQHRRKSANQANTQFLKLPLKELYRAGIITPMTKKGKLTEEYRRIKRPLLKKVINEIRQPLQALRDQSRPTLRSLRNQSRPLLKHLRHKNKALAKHKRVEPNAPAVIAAMEENRTDPKNVIVVTSSVSGEGKSYTAANLAMTLSIEKERTVLLIDADVIRGSLSTMFDTPTKQLGLTDVLNDDDPADVSDVIMQTNIQNLRFMCAGTNRANTSEMLSSNATSELIQELANRYHDRIIVLDCPPMLQTNEANILTDLAGQVVFVVAEQETKQKQVINALSQIDPDKDVGVILNKSSFQIGSYDYHLNKYT